MILKTEAIKLFIQLFALFQEMEDNYIFGLIHSCAAVDDYLQQNEHQNV